LYVEYFGQSNKQLILNRRLADFYQSILRKYLSYLVLNKEFLTISKQKESQSTITTVKFLQEIISEIINLLVEFEDRLISTWDEKSELDEAEYIISIGKIYEQVDKESITNVLTTIIANDQQVKEWAEISNKEPTEIIELLKQKNFFKSKWKNLAIDTSYFDSNFKKNLLRYLPENSLLQRLDGHIIKSDNWQALQSLKPIWEGKIKCIYIDPPYNTGNIDFSYEDSMSRFSWMVMMRNRLELTKDFLSEDGVILISISDNELYNLKLLLEEIFGDNFIGVIITQTNPRGRTLDKHLAKTHEYLLIYAKNKTSDTTLFEVPKSASQLAEYNKIDEKGHPYRLIELRNRNPRFNRKNRPNLFYPIYADPKTMNVSLMKTSKFCVEIFPKNSRDEDDCWTWGKEKAEENIEILSAKKVSTGAWRVFRKAYLSQEGASTTKEKSIWMDKSLSNERGKEQLRDLFGYHAHGLGYPKSVDYIERIIKLATGDNHVILDFFAGSGTTAHAVLHSNKTRNRNTKFLLVEKSSQFNEVIIPRIKKLSNSYQWKKGEPLVFDGQGIFVKYQILEHSLSRLFKKKRKKGKK
jgi:adenine-specific DNA-methyltransferase